MTNILYWYIFIPLGGKSEVFPTRGPIEFLFLFIVYEYLWYGDLAFYLTMTTMTKPIFFVLKFLHTHTVYSLGITIYICEGKVCRTKVLWV